MAKELNMQFSGTIGPLVGCLRNGKYYYRSKPGKVRQTKATKKSSSIFATASKAGKVMRLNLRDSIPNPKDINMQRRLVGQISNWLRLSKGAPPTASANIPFVNHFNFNPGKPLEESFRLPINFIQTAPGQTELQVPGFIPVEAIKAPADTLQVELCISAVALRLNNYSSFGNESISITIPYNSTAQPAQNIPLALQTDPGNMLVAAILIRFTVEIKSRVTNTRADKLPAAIVGTIYL